MYKAHTNTRSQTAREQNHESHTVSLTQNPFPAGSIARWATVTVTLYAPHCSGAASNSVGWAPHCSGALGRIASLRTLTACALQGRQLWKAQLAAHQHQQGTPFDQQLGGTHAEGCNPLGTHMVQRARGQHSCSSRECEPCGNSQTNMRSEKTLTDTFTHTWQHTKGLGHCPKLSSSAADS